MIDVLPLISVIMPAYNSERTIADSIESVLDQTFTDFELIIVDDGSTDETTDVIARFQDRRIVYLYQDHTERSEARNNGISNADGKYIAFIDADDLWVKDKLEKQVSKIEKKPELGLLYSDAYYFDDLTGERVGQLGEKHEMLRGKAWQNLLLGGNFIQTPTVIVPKYVFDHVGGFDPMFTTAEDWDMWLRIAYHYPIDFVDEPLIHIRLHATVTSWERNADKLYRGYLMLLDKAEDLYIGEDDELRDSLDKRRARAHYIYGVMSIRKGLLDKSWEAYQKSKQLNPFYFKLYLRFGQWFLVKMLTSY